MSQIVLYAAISLDGKLARLDGALDWLPQPAPDAVEDYGYADFYRGIDAAIMGRNTFDTMMVMGGWPYADRPSYVFSHRPLPDTADRSIHRVDQDIVSWLQQPQQAVPARLWLVGGGDLVAQCLAANLIDEMIVTVVPVVLGAGINLFGSVPESKWALLGSEQFGNGLCQVHYRRV